MPPDPHARPLGQLLRAYGRGALSLGPQILANQWLPPAVLERLALARLRRLVAHAKANVPFYARHLAGIDPRFNRERRSAHLSSPNRILDCCSQYFTRRLQSNLVLDSLKVD